MKRPFSVTNRSFFQNEELLPLLDLAWRVAWNRRPPPVPGRAYWVTVAKTKFCYCGHAGSNRCLLRLGNPAKEWAFPRSATYPKFKDMPEYNLNSWREVIVHLAAHEFAHLTGFSGRRSGEFSCELTGWDAVDAYRKEQPLIDARIAQAIEAKRQKASTLLSREEAARTRKKSPEYRLERLAAQEKVWLRKLRTALTKMKKIKRSKAAILRWQAKTAREEQLNNIPCGMAGAAKPPTTEWLGKPIDDLTDLGIVNPVKSFTRPSA